jgi:cytoskeletal protein CcmA (bactofilin family)
MPIFGSSPSDNHEASLPTPPTFTASKKTPATIIAKGVKLEGEFKSQGDVLIEGEVQGTIQTEGLLTLGNEAFLKAGVTASDAIIAGKLEGNINIKHKLEIKSTAKIQGDITCESITVESGAVLQGSVKSGVVATTPKVDEKSSQPISPPATK